MIQGGVNKGKPKITHAYLFTLVLMSRNLIMYKVW